MYYDYSTINLEELRKLPLYQMPKGNQLSDHLGSGCAGDAPGYPSYFIQSVYNAKGDTPEKGPHRGVIVDPETEGLYVIDDVDLRTLWKPLSMDNPRFKAWEIDKYIHSNHGYYNPEPDKHGSHWFFALHDILIFHEDGTIDIDNQFAMVLANNAAVDQYDENLSGKERAKFARLLEMIQETVKHRDLLSADNYMPVRSIREFYPDYKFNLAYIKHAPEGINRNERSWERGEDVLPPVRRPLIIDEHTNLFPVSPTVLTLMIEHQIEGDVEEGGPPPSFDEDRVVMTRWTATYRRGNETLTLYYYTSPGIKETPTPDQVLSRYLSDIHDLDYYDGFEDWASNFGYSTDSRKAEKAYNKTVEVGQELREFLGESYDTFIEAE